MSKIADDPEDVIVSAAKRLDARHYPSTQVGDSLVPQPATNGIPFQVGIQIVQIGDDASATAFLKELDDDLQHKHGIRVGVFLAAPLIRNST